MGRGAGLRMGWVKDDDGWADEDKGEVCLSTLCNTFDHPVWPTRCSIL